MARFGTEVSVTRGSRHYPAGTPGCLRLVRGVLIGARGNERTVRLLDDDPCDTVGWNRAGDVGYWSASAIRAVEVT